MIRTELTRFAVKKGKESKAEEWLKFLNEHMAEVLLTLDGEKMYVESIFREIQPDRHYLYWFSIQGEGGIEVTDSDAWIDQKHLAYWYECIDETVPAENLRPEVVMIAQKIQNVIKE